MSYQIRIESANGFYHVMNRGNNKLNIFGQDSSKDIMLRYFEKASKADGFEILCYCIMQNHYHLLVRTDNITSLSKALHQINLSYSRYYMNRFQYVGHVFQGRFSSCGINTKDYLSRVIRYIHQNPVRAKICDDAFFYYYSSFCEYAGRYTRNILAGNGLLLLEELGFMDFLSFKSYHAESPREDLDCSLLCEETLLLENKTKVKEFELSAAYALKASYADYSLLSGTQRHAFASLLKDSTTQLSNRTIAKISEIDRHKLSHL